MSMPFGGGGGFKSLYWKRIISTHLHTFYGFINSMHTEIVRVYCPKTVIYEL